MIKQYRQLKNIRITFYYIYIQKKKKKKLQTKMKIIKFLKSLI